MYKYIKGNVKLLGLIGYPISHTFSPLLINSICEFLNMNYLYIPLQVKPDGLVKTINAFKELEIKGLNVTMPYKTIVMDYIDNLSEEADIIGAVNTIKLEDNKLFGDNTDYFGFKKSIEYNNIDMEGKNTLILGAGGAAKAVALSCIHCGSDKLVILNRDLGKAQNICSTINRIQKNTAFFDRLEFQKLNKYINECDIIINTTSVGMSYNKLQMFDFDYNLLNSKKIVCDIIYNPCETELIKLAENKGCKTMNGIGMFVFQGVKAFEIWTGKEVPSECIDELIKKIEKASRNLY